MTDNPDTNKHAPHGEGGVPFYPLHFMKEAMVMIGITIFLIIVATAGPAGLEAAADSFTTPEHIKPEWYFLSMYQALKYVPQGVAFLNLTWLNVAVLVMGLAIMFLAVLPFVDRSPFTRARKRPVFLALGVAAVIALIVFTYLGHFSGHTDPIFHRVFR